MSPSLDPSRFFVTAPHGFEDLLLDEIEYIFWRSSKVLEAVGAKAEETVVRRGAGGVWIHGHLGHAYAVILWSRLAGRVSLPLFEASTQSDEAFHRDVAAFAWEKHLDPKHTLAVDFRSPGGAIRHTQYGAQRVKDGICDRLLEVCGSRPSVDVAEADVRIYGHCHDECATLGIDLGGQSLHRRGYREGEGGPAPLKENLAAALVARVGFGPQWDLEVAALAVREAEEAARKREEAAAHRQAKALADAAQARKEAEQEASVEPESESEMVALADAVVADVSVQAADEASALLETPTDTERGDGAVESTQAETEAPAVLPEVSAEAEWAQAEVEAPATPTEVLVAAKLSSAPDNTEAPAADDSTIEIEAEAEVEASLEASTVEVGAASSKVASKAEGLDPALGGVFLDPMCGLGTLVIEAALIAADIAPGLLRSRYGFVAWGGHQDAVWQALLGQAEARREAGKGRLKGWLAKSGGRRPIHGWDSDADSLATAKRLGQRAGIDAWIAWRRQDFRDSTQTGVRIEPWGKSVLQSGVQGFLVVNPPYGVRMGDRYKHRQLYADLGEMMHQRLEGWRAAVISDDDALLNAVSQRTLQKKACLNGALRCTFMEYAAGRRPRAKPIEALLRGGRKPSRGGDGGGAARGSDRGNARGNARGNDRGAEHGSHRNDRSHARGAERGADRTMRRSGGGKAPGDTPEVMSWRPDRDAIGKDRGDRRTR